MPGSRTRCSVLHTWQVCLLQNRKGSVLNTVRRHEPLFSQKGIVAVYMAQLLKGTISMIVAFLKNFYDHSFLEKVVY